MFKSYPRAMNCLKELSKKTVIKLRVSTTAGINTTALVIIVNRNNNSTMYSYTLEHTCTVYKYIVFTFSCLKTQIQRDTINTCTYMHMFCTYLYVNTYVYMLYIQTHTHTYTYNQSSTWSLNPVVINHIPDHYTTGNISLINHCPNQSL